MILGRTIIVKRGWLKIKIELLKFTLTDINFKFRKFMFERHLKYMKM